MKRQEYQEKFIIPKKKIETEVQDTLYLFEEVKNLIEKQDEDIQHISDVIEDTKSKVIETESIVEKSEKLKTNYVGMVIGATLGSLVVVYSPYLAIGSILLGGYIGKNCQ